MVILALPHCLTADDEYMGFRIPAGTMVLPNVWSVVGVLIDIEVGVEFN